MKPWQEEDYDPKESPEEKRRTGKVEGNQRDKRHWNEEDDRECSALLNAKGKNRSHCKSDQLPPPCSLQRYLVDYKVTRFFLLNVELDQRQWRWKRTPRIDFSEPLLKVLLREDSYAWMLRHLLFCGEAHHCFSFPTSTKKNVGHRMPRICQINGFALQQGCLS